MRLDVKGFSVRVGEDGQPVYPTDADGRPQLPSNEKGEKLFPLAGDGFPLFPYDRTNHQPCFPYDDNAQPIFPIHNGRPMVPTDVDGTFVSSSTTCTV